MSHKNCKLHTSEKFRIEKRGGILYMWSYAVLALKEELTCTDGIK